MGRYKDGRWVFTTGEILLIGTTALAFLTCIYLALTL